jgi:hypothetical protein
LQRDAESADGPLGTYWMLPDGQKGRDLDLISWAFRCGVPRKRPVVGLAAFVTGSRAYGTPTKDSDIDLVALTSEDDATALSNEADKICSSGMGAYQDSDIALRFGRLNLICLTDLKHFQIWKAENELMIADANRLGPLTREQAVVRLRTARRQAGIKGWE